MYTTPSTTTGAAASEPVAPTPAAAWPASLKLHASRSRDTFAEEIIEPAASRVLARSPFGYGHDPDAVGAPLKTVVAGRAVVPLHAASTLTAMSRDKAVPPRVTRLLIVTPMRPTCRFLFPAITDAVGVRGLKKN